MVVVVNLAMTLNDTVYEDFSKMLGNELKDWG